MTEPAGTKMSTDSPAPVKKRSLFTKPTYTQPTEAEEAVEFFSRAKEIFPERLAEEERKRQKKLAKLERKRSTASAERKASQTPESKRRRLSSDADRDEVVEYHCGGSPEYRAVEETFRTSGTSTRSTPPKYASKQQGPEHQTSPTSLLGTYTRSLKAQRVDLTPKKAAVARSYISLSDSEEEGSAKAPKNPIVLDDDDDHGGAFMESRPTQVEEEPQLSDEEFPELVARAREREKQKAQERVNAMKATENQEDDLRGGVSGDDIFQAPFTPLFEIDPTIELLITSEIDGTNPLKVRRKLSQRLKEVRLSWCDKQRLNGMPMNPAMRDAVFFTWKGIRVYDYTTCKSLGFNKTRSSGASFEAEGFDCDGRVHLEAWTEDLFQAYEKIRAKQKMPQDNGIEEALEEKNRDKTEKIRLILVDRDSKELKIVVKTTTSVSKLIAAFCEDRGLDESREVTLYFDGDKLDPGITVGKTDLTNMDSVEVHVK